MTSEPAARPSSRWLVKIPLTAPITGSHVEDVGADSVRIEPSGALAFYDTDGDLLVAYALHQWIEVTQTEKGSGEAS